MNADFFKEIVFKAFQATECRAVIKFLVLDGLDGSEGIHYRLTNVFRDSAPLEKGHPHSEIGQCPQASRKSSKKCYRFGRN